MSQESERLAMLEAYLRREMDTEAWVLAHLRDITLNHRGWDARWEAKTTGADGQPVVAYGVTASHAIRALRAKVEGGAR